MGTFTTLAVGKFHLYETKSEVIREVMTVFREINRREFIRKESETDLPLVHGTEPTPNDRVERRTTVWRCTWNGNATPVCIEQPAKSPMWSVGFVWVHKEHRKSGVAYEMLKEAKRSLHLEEDSVGWYTPFSEDGKTFYAGCTRHTSS